MNLDTVQDAKFSCISELATAQISAEKEVALLQLTLKKANIWLDQIKNKLLPDAMAEVGMDKFTLSDGRGSVTINQKTSASITADNKPEVFKWLREIGEDSIIKSEVRISFGKGDLEKAETLVGELVAKGLDAFLNEDIHSSTLSAFVREKYSEGELVSEKITVYQYKEAKIK